MSTEKSAPDDIYLIRFAKEVEGILQEFVDYRFTKARLNVISIPYHKTHIKASIIFMSKNGPAVCGMACARIINNSMEVAATLFERMYDIVIESLNYYKEQSKTVRKENSSVAKPNKG